jgi:hypothetical protein
MIVVTDKIVFYLNDADSITPSLALCYASCFALDCPLIRFASASRQKMNTIFQMSPTLNLSLLDATLGYAPPSSKL